MPSRSRRSRFRSPLRRVGCSPTTSPLASTCRPSPARRWTASRCARPTCRAGCRSCSGSPRGYRQTGRWNPERRWRSRRGAPCRTAPMRSCRSSLLSKLTTMWRSRIPLRPARTYDRSEVTSAPVTFCSRPARCSAPRRSVRSQQPASRRFPARDGRPSSSSAPVRSCARQGRSSGPGQIYESNGPMLAAAFEAAGAVVERIGPVTDDEESHRAALERGLAADVLVSSGGVSVGAARPRAPDPGRARGRGGLLGRRRAAREAAGVRQPRRDARVRPSGKSRLVARRRRALRAAGAAGSAGGRAAGPALPRRDGSHRRSGANPARDDLSPGTDAGRRGRDRARAAQRARSRT